MDVTYTRPELTAALRRWRLVRDVCKGSEKIKGGKDDYLPKPNPQDKSKENEARYDSYLARAVFYNATGRTKNGLIGAVFTTWPTLKVPKLLEYVNTDIDGVGVSIYQQSQSVIGHLLEVGRHGLLVDYPAIEGNASLADMQAGRIRATVTSYKAEDIINWRTRQVGGQHVLSLVVLKEQYEEDTADGFGQEVKDQYRVLRLTEEGRYAVEIWRNEGGWNLYDYREPTDGRGNKWTEIPFTFLGSESNDSSIDDAPLYDMAELNIAHYRNSADYEDSAYLVGQPQVWMSGLDEQWRDWMQDNGIYFGSRAPILLPQGGSAGILQAQPNSIAKEAMDAKERQMVALGARLIEQGSGAKTATQEQNENAAEHSVLSLVVSNVSEAYTKVLEWMGAFMNANGTMEYTLNQNFVRVQIDSNLLASLIKGVQAGLIPQSDFWRQLRDYQLIDPEKTDDDVRDELETSSTGLGLEDADDGGESSTV
ncbi:uncharacterized protein DUF4055 [Pseudomonas duriflava]|uniref:Uncharacterized protein DUF4055 n=1 Tax=Pseudomonas duriflava TaxID=459528 RepID=A0A562Q8A6_9PSED|nr:DUF4055 domain-containing protein [Pseudomonas duriflava]TWI52973.1 uncharacterized protein DUF4055 [Pseudomonas duriflava]